MKAPISLIVLTYNDEIQIEHCLKSVCNWVGEIIIVDSFSTDKTLEICRKYTDKIYQHPFENQAKQFNWALDNIEIKYDWIMRLDSDEIIPNKLREEVIERVGKEPDVVGYYLNRRMYWMGRWLRHGGIYPHYILRIFKKGYGRYEERTEEHLIVHGKTAKMKNDFLENNRNNLLEYFTLKHLQTAKGEVSEELIGTGEGGIQPSLFGTKPQRIRWLKLNIYYRFPLFIRGFLYFLYRYVFRLGFLDGKEGLIFHVLQGFWYRFYIDSLIHEEKTQWYKKERDYSEI